jgi:hypothetical protein
MSENPEEHSDLDGGKVVPIDIQEGELASGALEHDIECPSADLDACSPQEMTGVVVVAEAERLKMDGDAVELRMHSRAEPGVHGER